MSWAPRPADWLPPGSGSGPAGDAEAGVCDFLQIVVKKGSSCETGVLGKANGSEGREEVTLFPLPGGSQEGLNPAVLFCERRQSSAGSEPAAAGLRKGPALEKGFQKKMLWLPAVLLAFLGARPRGKVNWGN